MGFKGVYGQFNAGYGEEVAVYRSSGDGVWLAIKQVNANHEARDLQGELVNKIGEAAAHITPAQAVVLRAALDNYLAEREEE